MVQSKLEPSVEYPNVKQIEESDKDKDTIIYKVKINGIKLLIAVGNPISTYAPKGVVYYPIYLIYNEKVISRIGLYEMKTDLADTIIGYNEEIDISLFHSPPLFYKDINIGFLKKYKTEFSDFDEDIEDDKKDQEGDDSETSKKVEVLSVDRDEGDEGSEDDDETKEKEDTDISKASTTAWIQVFLKSNKYTIEPNDGSGDCLFYVISSALASRGIQKSVTDLRKILADNVNEEILHGYKTMFDSTKNAIEELKKEILTYNSHLSKLKKQFKLTKDRTAAQSLVIQAEELVKQKKIASSMLNETIENHNEFKFMKGVNTIDELKAKIYTREFWADTWAISTLERELEIKLILFSKEAYENGDLANVLQCGQLNDSKLEERGNFMPKFYILTNYVGLHYELIIYNGKGALEFKDIPLSIKNMIVEKCMERNAGPYYIISSFREYAEKLKLTLPGEDTESTVPNELYDSEVVFQFYSKSNKGPKPGKGVGEKIPSEKIKDFVKLATIPEWRRKLSNFWKAPFNLDGKRWQTVEHYYQGSKYKKNNPEVYNEFALDSGSELSKDPVMAKGAGGKKGSYKGKRIIPKGVTIDPDFFKGRSEKTMEDAMMAKFTQNEDLRQMLLDTRSAKLVHYVRGGPPEVFNDLMRVRNTISQT